MQFLFVCLFFEESTHRGTRGVVGCLHLEVQHLKVNGSLSRSELWTLVATPPLPPGIIKRQSPTCLTLREYSSSGFAQHNQSPWAYLHVVGMLQFMSNINQPSLPTPFFLYSVLVSISVFMALSTVSHSINSSDNFPFSHSVLPVLSLPYWSFQLYISL